MPPTFLDGKVCYVSSRAVHELTVCGYVSWLRIVISKFLWSCCVLKLTQNMCPRHKIWIVDEHREVTEHNSHRLHRTKWNKGDKTTQLSWWIDERRDLTFFAVRTQGPKKKNAASYCCLLHEWTMFCTKRLRMMCYGHWSYLLRIYFYEHHKNTHTQKD